MVWIGGAPGAGKSTIARDIARRWDLPLHPVDLWTYDHVGRMPPMRSLADDLAEGPAFAAEAFVRIARTRLELVAEDVRGRGLGDVPALVEGPQLFPSMADGLRRRSGWCRVPSRPAGRGRSDWPGSTIRTAGLDWRVCWRGTPYWLSGYGGRRSSVGVL